MKALRNSRNCENCGSNHKSKPVCFYENGWHCFSCGASKIYDRSYTPKERYNSVQVPEWPLAKRDFNEFTLENQLRLTKFGLSPQVCQKYCLMETEENGLILPNIKEGKLISYQVRWYEPRRIQTFGEKSPVYTEPRGDVVILCEDFFSYMRIDELYNGICLFGTKASHEILSYVVNTYTNIIIWLDDDHMKEKNSGQIAAKIIMDKLRIMVYTKQTKRGFTISNLRIGNVVAKEPKELVDQEIKTIIEGVLS